MGQRRWYELLSAYPLWVLTGGLALWVLQALRSAFLVAAALYYVRGSAARGWRAGFCDKAGIVAAGLLWLVFVVGTESHFREGAERRVLLRRFALVAGAEVLLLSMADLSLCLMRGARALWVTWVVAGAELAVGLVLLLLSRPPFLFPGKARKGEEAAGGEP